jgi:haloacetate dehalogenase
MADFFPRFGRNRIVSNGVTINLVQGGTGDPILLLHGYPQTHVLWHKVAPMLAVHYTVIAPDLRGYGDSDKPKAAPDDHSVYCKRTLANDIVGVMDALGFRRWHVVGHDRGARVAHRMALDHPDRVGTFTSLDVVASQAAFDGMDASLAFAFFHWNLMRQPYPLPETLIGNSARVYFDFLMERWCATPGAITSEAYAEYVRCFCTPEGVAATCAEYRAVALDLEHDEGHRGRKIAAPMLVLWGSNTTKRPGGQTGMRLDMLATWRERAHTVEGRGLDCGHFLPEEKPDEVAAGILAFIGRHGLMSGTSARSRGQE